MVTALPQSDLDRLLERTSRTFALAIPLLPAMLAREVGLAYLLFRIADELEDAPLWGRDRRARALASFAHWLESGPRRTPSPSFIDLVKEQRPTDDDGCLELLERADDVLGAVRATGVAGAIVAQTKRTAVGMAEFVARQDDAGALTLVDVRDLQRYAYAVAGIVGELLTELFACAHPGIAAARSALDADAVAFGEGLQLVNILKDASSDASEGRAYLPPGTPRGLVVELARSDLVRAQRYVATLEGAAAPSGVVAFCDLPVRLAVATLDALEAGAPKLARAEVHRIYADVAGRAR